MKKLLILPAVLLAAGFAMGACNNDDTPDNPGPVTTVVPSEVPTSVPVEVPGDDGQPSVSASPTSTVVPSEVTKDPSCGPEDDNCGNGTDKPDDGK